jgi:type II secretory pathway pseudopilin PulG
MRKKAYSLIEIIASFFIMSCVLAAGIPVFINTLKHIETTNNDYKMVFFNQNIIEFYKSLPTNELNNMVQYGDIYIDFSGNDDLYNNLKNPNEYLYKTNTDENKKYKARINIKKDTKYENIQCFEIQCIVWNIESSFNKEIQVYDMIIR